MRIDEFTEKLGKFYPRLPMRYDLGHLAPGTLIPYVNKKDFAMTYHGSIFMMMEVEAWYEHLSKILNGEDKLQYEGLEYEVPPDSTLYVSNNEHMETHTLVDGLLEYDGFVIITTVFKADE